MALSLQPAPPQQAPEGAWRVGGVQPQSPALPARGSLLTASASGGRGGPRTFPVPPRNKAEENAQQRRDINRQLCRGGTGGPGLCAQRHPAAALVGPASRIHDMTCEQVRLSFLLPSAAQGGPLGYLLPQPRYGGKAAGHPGGKGTQFWGSRADEEECGGFNRGGRQGPLRTSSSAKSSAGRRLGHQYESKQGTGEEGRQSSRKTLSFINKTFVCVSIHNKKIYMTSNRPSLAKIPTCPGPQSDFTVRPLPLYFPGEPLPGVLCARWAPPHQPPGRGPRPQALGNPDGARSAHRRSE